MPHARIALCLAVGVASALLSGCVSQDVASQVNAKIGYGMSGDEVAEARNVARRLAEAEGAEHVIARATADGSAPTPGGTARPCTGRLIYVTMTGQFPQAPHSAGDVTGQALTLDAPSGHLCTQHYLTGVVTPDLESVQLFTL